jgi:single-strand DNA-binding protein
MSYGDTTLTVVGNLTADPELRYTPNGQAVAAFTVAASRRVYDQTSSSWKDGDTLFMRCSVWRQMAEHVTESLSKGNRVVVSGRLRQREYEKDGAKRTIIELEVEEVGASLRYATAKLSKAGRESVPHPADQAGRADPWAAAGGPSDGQPPF